MTLTAGTGQRPHAGGEDAARTRHGTVAPLPPPDQVPSPAPQAPEPRDRAVHRAAATLKHRYWSTLPARLRLLRAAVLLLCGALGLLLVLAGLAASSTWNAIADRDAPRTTSAADLNLALNDMDAQAANLLLSSGDAGRGRLQVPYEKAAGYYDDARRAVSRDLRTLAVAAQGDRRAERTVEMLTDAFARYQERVGRALENDTRTGGKPAALEDYRAATDLLQGELLPDARTLVASNNAAFNSAYASERARLTAELVAALTIGAVLLILLGALQWYLARRFRRRINPALAAATLSAGLAVVLGGVLLSTSFAQLKVARRDAFDSIVALSRARAIAYDANADESRYLLDADRRDQYERAFLRKSQELYGIPGATLRSYDTELDRTWDLYLADHTALRFTGEFRRELDNITFDGERAAAERTVETYTVYQRDDRRIRELFEQGRVREAVAFCIGWEKGTSNAHFQEWMKALDSVTAINRTAFEGAVGKGRSTVSTLLPASGGALAVAAALTVLGLRPRLAEFRG